MKKTIQLVLLLLLCIALNAHPATNGWEKMNLQGRVKEYKSTSPNEVEYNHHYYFDEEGNILYNEMGVLEWSGEYYYKHYRYDRDDQGRITQILIKSENDTYEESSVFTYDDRGVLTKAVVNRKIMYSAADDFVYHWEEQTWNELEQKVYAHGINEWEKEFYSSFEYDAKGFLVAEHKLDREGNILETYRFVNDQYGRLLCRNGVIVHVYKYDATGNVIGSGYLRDKHYYIFYDWEPVYY